MKTPYKVEYTLHKEFAEKEDGRYVVYHRGTKTLVDGTTVSFIVTDEDFLELIMTITEGTKGMLGVKRNW